MSETNSSAAFAAMSWCLSVWWVERISPDTCQEYRLSIAFLQDTVPHTHTLGLADFLYKVRQSTRFLSCSTSSCFAQTFGLNKHLPCKSFLLNFQVPSFSSKYIFSLLKRVDIEKGILLQKPALLSMPHPLSSCRPWCSSSLWRFFLFFRIF